MSHYSEPSQSKKNVRAWVDSPRLARRKITDRKWHIIVAMNFRSDYYFEVVEKGLAIIVYHMLLSPISVLF